MRFHYRGLILAFVGYALIGATWANSAAPVPELRAPERGSLAGSLARLSYGPADLTRGAFTLPGPLEAPQERGPLLAQVFPSYSPEAGLSEWGMGWHTDLAIVRSAVVGDIDYRGDEFASPWGRLVAGDDGYFYPSGMRADVRLRREPSGWTAVLADGTRLVFTHRIDTRAGHYAWYLRIADNPLGDRTEFTYRDSNAGRAYVSEVTYGGRGRTDYRIRLDYEALNWPFTSYRSGTPSTLSLRVRAVHVEAQHALSGRFEPRWRYELAYEQSPLGPAFYLSSVTRIYASGAMEPASRYTYDLGTQPLATAGFVPVTALGAYRIEHSLASAYLDDRDRDGMVELYHSQSYFRFEDGVWRRERRDPPWTACEPESEPPRERPRSPVHILVNDSEERLLRRYSYKDGVTAYAICTLRGRFITQYALGGDWRYAWQMDLNHDNRKERINLDFGMLTVLENLSTDSRFELRERAPLRLSPKFRPHGFWVVDLTGDGNPEVVARHRNRLFAWRGLGTFRFHQDGKELNFWATPDSPLTHLDIGNYTLRFVDLNRDGLADLLLSNQTQVRIFYNHGYRFIERRVPVLNALPDEAVHPMSQEEAIEAVADLTGDGNIDIVYEHQRHRVKRAWALTLTSTGTGLLHTADDGKGTVLTFRYDRATPRRGVPDRPAVLSALTVDVAGMDPVTYRYEYEHPVAHSRGLFLIGYGKIRRIGPQLEEEVWLRHDDDIAGVVEAVRQRDTSTPGLERYVSRQFTEQQFAGVRWLRPELEQMRWRQGGEDSQRGATITTFYKAFEPGGRCPSRTEILGPSGELVRESIRASIPTMRGAIHCLTSFERDTGMHADSAHDFMHEREIVRNLYGQVTDVRQMGDGSALTAYSVDYDHARRVRAVHQPGRGTVQIAYDDRTGLIREIVAADGVARRVTARDAVSDAFTALIDDRGPGGVLTSFYRYDPFERLEASWQDFGGSSASLPLMLLRYVYPSRAGPGVVSEHALVDAGAGSLRTQVAYVAADGTPLGTARRIPGGWAYSGLVKHERHTNTETAYRRPVLPAAHDPMRLAYDGLYVGGVFLGRIEKTGFGEVVNTSTTVQQGVQREATSERAISADGLQVTTTVENGTHATAIATDAAGQVRWTRDAIGAITYFTYDVMGRLVRIELPDGQVHRARYDRFGRIARVERDGLVLQLHAPITSPSVGGPASGTHGRGLGAYAATGTKPSAWRPR